MTLTLKTDYIHPTVIITYFSDQYLMTKHTKDGYNGCKNGAK